MTRPLEGVSVIEIAEWIFVPGAGALLADLGADVIKIEHPVRGDPYRTISTQGLAADLAVMQVNRGKRSCALNLKEPEGLAVMWELISRSDVVLTSLRLRALGRLGLTPDAVRERNPRTIFARGHGLGVRGPEASKTSFDMTSVWARGSLAHDLTPPTATSPIDQPSGLGDRAAALGLAFGIAAALVRRSATGEGGTVDVSLLATAAWLQSSNVLAGLAGLDWQQPASRAQKHNPLVNCYPTADGRWIQLCLTQPDRYWSGLCRALGRPELEADPRFADHVARSAHAGECVAELDRIFRQLPLAAWRTRLASFDGAWEAVQTGRELATDPQVVANGYVSPIEDSGGVGVRLISGPAQFDEQPAQLRRAPELGEHTEQILLELGRSWDDIERYKSKGVIV